MNQVHLEIDGREVGVPEGTTVFEAARSAGIEIPHLCQQDDLSPTAACRLCVVEVEGARTLVASCAHPVADKMVVSTNTERVLKARKLVIELLLSDHPVDCMTCEKSGACQLEKYAYELGVSKTRFQGEKHEYPLDEANPFYLRDYNKCILCERCVKACREVQFVEAIDLANRGFDAKVATPYDRSMMDSTCVFCGQCVASCPTGALVEKTRIGKGREWELEKTKTTCPYCGVGCNLELNVKGGEIVKVSSPMDGAPNYGNLCVKGRFGWEFVNHPDRLKKPLVKKDGVFVETEWDEALDLVAEKFGAYKGDAFGSFSSARVTNEENYVFQKFARAVMGTNNVDHCARL